MTTVVLGDFNDWLWAGSVHGVLARELPGRSRFRTFPSFFPILRLDRVFCRPASSLMQCFRDPAGRYISDHLVAALKDAGLADLPITDPGPAQRTP